MPDLKSFFHGGELSDEAAEFLSNDRIGDYGTFDKRMVGRLLRKFGRGVPENIGYRDNMLITFILSCQMATYWLILTTQNWRRRLGCIPRPVNRCMT